MKFKRIIGTILAVTTAASTLNTAFSAEPTPTGAEPVIEEAVTSASALEALLSDTKPEAEAVQQADLVTTTTIYEYAVEGGYVYFEPLTKSIVDCDTTVTSADIPSIIEGVSVTYINESAFCDCSNIISITIPDSVTVICSYAFRSCSSLENITIPSSVKSIEKYAFYDCSSLTSITIPDSVTSISDSVFANCASLTNITIPDSITSIRSYAFANCTSLTSIIIPDSVTSIGSSAFAGCTSLTSVTISDSITSLGYYVFKQCTSLANITIPDSVTSIGSATFIYCYSLTSITIPDSVTSIGSSAFASCTSLTSITIPDSVTSIDSYAFQSCTSLTSITIPNSVTSLGGYTFSGCSSLTNITMSNSLTSIGDAVFESCTSLTSITIPDSVTSIGGSAFYRCTSLTSITIPNSVTSIGDGAFRYCSSLTNITIPDSVISIGDYTFYNCTSLTSITIPNGITSIGNEVFYNCGSLTSITIPNSITSIGSAAYYQCTSLTDITIPNSVTSIDDAAFRYCTNLTSITMSNGITSIDDLLFDSCKNLTSIIIPNSVTSIGYAAFRYCTNLTSITIPSNVTSIDNYAFYGCDKDLLVFYVVEGSYADTWATENGWMVSYISEEETEETTEAALRSLDVSLGADKDIIYNVDEGTYSADSFSLGGYVEFLHFFEDAEDYETGYPKNVSVMITLPEGFYFESEEETEAEEGETGEGETETEEGEGSEADGSTRTLTFEEITGREYINETVYIDSPAVGTAKGTVYITGDNVVEKTVSFDIVVAKKQFNMSKYRANYILGSSFGSSIEEFFMGTYETPAYSLKESAEENGLDIATTAWSLFMNTLAVLDDVSSLEGYLTEEYEMYEAIIFNIMETSVDYRVMECINNDITKFTKKLVSTVTSEMKSLYSVDYSTLNDLSKLSEAEKKSVQEILSDAFKEDHPDAADISKLTSFIGKAISAAEDIESFCELVSSYYEITQLNDAMKQILQDMSDKCSSDNTALNLALINCTEIMDDSFDQLVDDMATRAYCTLGLKAATAILDKFWSTAKDNFVASSPAAFAYYTLKASYAGSKYLTEMLFNSDSIEEKYCNIVALVNTEELLRAVYTDEKNSYKSSLSEDAAEIYNNMIDVMFNVLDTDCDYAVSFAEAVNKGSYNGFFFKDTTIEDFTTQVESIQDSYTALHEQSLKNWIYGLEEDYPSQYENYKYILEMSGDELTKAYKIECPVDVYVYDTDGVCVGYVKDNKPYCRSDAEITLAVNGDAKTIYMYGENEYTIVYEGNDSGSMDISVTEYGTKGEETRNVYFNDISLTNGLTYTSEEKANTGTYTLTTESGRSIESDYDSADSSAETYTITLTNGYFTGSPSLTAELHAGERAEIAALISSGSEFSGWTSDAGAYIFDDTDSIITEITMPACDVVITANISSSEEPSTEISTEEPSTTPPTETSTETSTETTTEGEFVSPPAFGVAGVFGGRNVTFTSETDGAVIYYSSTSSTLTTDDISVSNGETVLFEDFYGTIYARAYHNGSWSNVARLILKIPVVNTPTVTASGSVVTVKSTTPSSFICYTTDGTEPIIETDGTVTNGTWLRVNGARTNSGTITAEPGDTVRAVAVRNCFTTSESAAVYVNVSPAAFTVVGTFGGRNVTFKSDTSGAKIYYSSTTSSLTTSDKCVSNGETVLFEDFYGTIYARAYYNGKWSNVSRLILKIPTINDPTITYSGGKATIRTTTPSCYIYYTTDGSTPSITNGKKLCSNSYGQITVSSGTTIKAIAVRSCFTNSEVVTYTVS